MSNGIVSKIRENFWTYVLAIAILAIGGVGYFGGKHMLAKPDGTTCDAQTKCRGAGWFSTGMCLEGEGASYCTHECSATSDCSDGLACEPIEGTWTTETTRGNHATQRRTSQGTKMLCVKR